MLPRPDKDCAHLREEHKPNIIDGKIVGSTLTDWCCDIDGSKSCGTADCPTDRKHANARKRGYWWEQGQYE